MKSFLKDTNTDNLRKEKTDCLRGIFAIFVLLHHLWQNTGLFENNVLLSVVFEAMGRLPVAGFFFLSGYGMMISYRRNGAEYAKKLFIRKAVPFYIVSLLFAVIVSFLTDASIISKLKLIYNFGQVGYFWYLELQLLVYILFWLVFGTKWPEKVKTTAFSFAILMLICVFDYLRLGFWWQCSTVCVILGLLWASAKEEIESTIFAKKSCPLFLILTFMLFCAFMVAQIKFVWSSLFLTESVSAMLFVVFVIMLIRVTPIVNPVTKFLGKISLEIYATQCIVISFFHKNWLGAPFQGVNIENPWIYCIAVLACTIGISAVIHPAVSKFMSLKIWRRQ